MPLSDSFVKKPISLDEELEVQRHEALLQEMGISRSDADKLRNSMLSADEAVSAKKEELSHVRQHRGRKPEWQEFLNVKARMGRVLSSSDFIYKLRQVLPTLRCTDGRVRNTISLFAPAIKTFEDGFHWGYVYLGWCHFGWNPEYTIDYCDEDGVPMGKRQGWRNILLNGIILKDGTGKHILKEKGIVQDGSGRPLRLLREDVVEDEFGSARGEAASLYRKQLWEFRNNKQILSNQWF